VSYGRTTRELKQALVDVLEFHRVRAHLGAVSGWHPATTTATERHEMVETILRFRQPVLTWAARAAAQSPEAGTGGRHGAGRRLATGLAALVPPPAYLPGGRGPRFDELATAHPLPVVDAWRRVAVAAVDGLERDLPSIEPAVDLTGAERMQLTRDVVTVVEACEVLEKRWARTPGWRALSTEVLASVRRANRQLGARLTYPEPPASWTLDARGSLDTTVETSTFAAAQRLTDALHEPDLSARALRRVVHDGVHVRRLVAGIAGDAGEAQLQVDFEDAAGRLTALLVELRNVGSPVTGTSNAVRESADLRATVERDAPTFGSGDLLALGEALEGVDRALAVRVREGIDDRTYLGSWRNRLATTGPGTIRRAVPYFEPITTGNHPRLLAAVAALDPDRHTSSGPRAPVCGSVAALAASQRTAHRATSVDPTGP
jgi:hypothetical protein